MAKFYAVLQIIIAVLLTVAAVATLVNMVLIAMRPETISVVNVFVGQILIIACFLALARILLARGLKSFKSLTKIEDN